MATPLIRRLRGPLPWLVALIATILVANVIAARYIRASGRDAARAALLDMRLDLVERARSLEAELRAGRAELEFLAGSPSLSDLPAALRSTDPGSARFRRLGGEGDLLRYLVAHPELERLVVRDGAGRAIVAVGRRGSFPVPIPLEAADRELPLGKLQVSAPLSGDEGALVGDVNPASLFSSLATGTGRSVLLDEQGEAIAGTPEAFGSFRDLPDELRAKALADPHAARLEKGWATAVVHVRPPGHEPPTTWSLARAEREEALIAGLGPLAARYRTTVALNVLGLAGTLALGATAVRLLIRRTRLEEKAARDAELRELEARLHEADRLAAVGRTAATLAHEVRNPLEGMRNWLSLAEAEARDAGADAALRPMAKIGEGITLLTEVVRRVLALSSPSQGTFEEVDLDAVIRGTVELLESNPSFRGVTIAVQPSSEPVRLRGDRVLLRQLLLNLLLNARDAMEHGGTITVSTTAEAGRVRLVVSDTGPGLPEGIQGDAFEMGSSRKGSTGIGLALSAKVARAHGGTLVGANAPGGGATFTLDVPAPGPGAGARMGEATA